MFLMSCDILLRSFLLTKNVMHGHGLYLLQRHWHWHWHYHDLLTKKERISHDLVIEGAIYRQRKRGFTMIY
jgi:hypothetical protein